MNRRDDHLEDVTGYALGELTAEARFDADTHLERCPECAAEARELSAAFDAIGLSATPAAPQPSMKRRLLGALGPNHRPGALLASSKTARAVQWRPSLAWLAAATLILVLGGMLARSQQRIDRLLDERSTATAAIASLASDAATVAHQADLAVAILTAPDMRRIDLQGFEPSRDATARGYWSQTRGLLIVADRLPPPPPGRLYQVWLIGSGAPAPVSAGLIDGRAGRGMLIVPPPAGIAAGPLTVAVTDEPEGGLPAPSGSKHLAGSM